VCSWSGLPQGGGGSDGTGARTFKGPGVNANNYLLQYILEKCFKTICYLRGAAGPEFSSAPGPKILCEP